MTIKKIKKTEVNSSRSSSSVCSPNKIKWLK